MWHGYRMGYQGTNRDSQPHQTVPIVRRGVRVPSQESIALRRSPPKSFLSPTRVIYFGLFLPNDLLQNTLFNAKIRSLTISLDHPMVVLDATNKR
jgi:hypothetical protein